MMFKWRVLRRTLKSSAFLLTKGNTMNLVSSFFGFGSVGVAFRVVNFSIASSTTLGG